ncbi:hypothetical protein IMG5_167110 [Ichthyophthirius multifiliis]|uniref:Uncharacterized protein n=1 Tax=Ichthyophthirius multifiliis TaxID=5932 RepID=G0R0V7_ICHMU|nr:hypothetical protein IMG5_167110 [Ichthyophthirius multifiliis]EGR28917.1 hypothetical protein IMG5_167110 [Ichthyophthirius multifiliis]|eukprot:XP_004030153.1 hypothetical protein IMG5_167110 [Ichthyophthirius multifiliis]
MKSQNKKEQGYEEDPQKAKKGQMLIQQIREFLRKDEEGYSNENFDPTKYLVQLLIGQNKKTQIFICDEDNANVQNPNKNFFLERVQIKKDFSQQNIGKKFKNAEEFGNFVKENFNIDLNVYQYFEEKFDEMEDLVHDILLFDDDDVLQYFENLNSQNLLDFVDFSMKFDDLETVWEGLKGLKDDEMENLIPYCGKNDILNFVLGVISCQKIGKSIKIKLTK